MERVVLLGPDTNVSSVSVTGVMTSTWSSVSRGIRRHGDDAVLEAVEVNDADGELRHGVEAPEGSTTHGAHRGEGGGHPLQDPGPDEHPAI